jgi:hypothetical protein
MNSARFKRTNLLKMALMAAFVAALLMAAGVEAKSAAASVLEAEAMQESYSSITQVQDSGANPVGAVNANKHSGIAYASASAPVSGDSLTVRARGPKVNNQYPNLRVRVGGVLVHDARLQSGTYINVEIPASVSSGQKIEVGGANLGSGSRPLYVDSITINSASPPPPPSGLGLAIEGNQFLMDGQPFDMYGVRVAAASQSEELTTRLIDNLDEYKAHGVNTVTVFYMGCDSSNSDPFEPDGSGGVRLETDDAERMRRIIQAADARDMAVIVGIFYQRAPYTDVNTNEKVVDAIDAVVDDLEPYDNIIINIANEQNSTAYDTLGAPGNFRDPLKINDYITQVKTRDPNRLVGGGGYDNARNVVIGQHEHTDALLFDTSYGVDSEYSGTKYDYYRQHNVPDKPMVDVEMLGGYTANLECQPTAGVYTDACKQKHFTSTQDAISRPGLSVFFHSSKWIQGGGETRYHLGGQGTSSDPGMRWWFEYVRDNGIQ